MTKEIRVLVNGKPYAVQEYSRTMNGVQFTVNGRRYEVVLEESIVTEKLDDIKNIEEGKRAIKSKQRYSPKTRAKKKNGDAKLHVVEITAPMPGVIKALLVSEGGNVVQNQVLCRLEAMKMENNIHAPCSGRVDKIFVAEGEEVSDHVILIAIAPDSKD